MEDIDTSVNQTISEETMNEKQAGNPFERVEFYYMYSHPIVWKVSTNEERVLTSYVKGIKSQVASTYNVEETQKI